MNILLGKTLSELQTIVKDLGLPAFVAKQLAQWLYVQRVTSFDQMTNLSKSTRALLSEQYIIGRHAPVTSIQSTDGTVKYLFEIPETFNSKLLNETASLNSKLSTLNF